MGKWQVWPEFRNIQTNRSAPPNFSIGASVQAIAGFARKHCLMSDPTEIVLISGFAAAFGIFSVFLAFRLFRGARRTNETSLINAGEIDGNSPDQTSATPPALPEGKVPVWPYRLPDLLGMAFIYGVFFLLSVASARMSHDKGVELDSASMLVNIGFQFLLAGIVVIFVIRRIPFMTWLGLRWPNWPWVFLIAPCAVIFMWIVFGGLQISGYVKWMESLGAETVQDTVELLRKSEDPLVLGLMTFAAVVAAPLCEEIVFRGYFYPVAKKFAGPWPAAACSALVFAAAHGNLTALLPLFIFGGLLVFIYEKTGSLWAPIAVHFCFNSATVIVQMAVRYFHLPLDAAP